MCIISLLLIFNTDVKRLLLSWFPLLLLKCFSHIQLCTTPQMAAHQAPLSLGFSRQEHWTGLPFTSPMHASMHAKSLQSCPTLCNPMDSSPPGSSTHRILQARILEWVAISFVGVLHNFCYLFFFKSEEIYASDIFARSQTTVFLSWKHKRTK